MTKTTSSSIDPIARYGFSCLCGLTALLLTQYVGPFFKGSFFDLFQAAVVLSAWYGGLGPGVFTGILSILALDYFFIPPLHTFNLGLHDFLRLVIFGAVALLTSTLSDRLKQAKTDVQIANNQLEERIEKRTEELSESNRQLKTENAHRLEAEKALLEISDREQRRLGLDLHDGLCQILAGVRLLSENVKEKFLSRALPEAQDMEHIEDRLREALSQADQVSRGLYPVELEAHGLMAALQEFAENTSHVFPVTCQFKCPKPVLVHESTVATHLYRIAQEAVTNAIKGGQAKKITIKLIHRGAQTVLFIADNGVGLNNQPHRRGMGLKIMAYRARMINAQLKLYSRPKGGTLIRCSFNLAATKEAERHGAQI